MIYVVAFALSIAAGLLAWLVMTKKVLLPILFEAGLAVTSLGVVVAADTLLRGEVFNFGGAVMTLTGVLMLIASLVRERKKQHRIAKHGPPREIDGRHMGRITGGRRE